MDADQFWLSGSCWSKLTMTLINVTLNLQTYCTQNTAFFAEKNEKLLQCKSSPQFFRKKNITSNDFRCIRGLNELFTNEVTPLRTMGHWALLLTRDQGHRNLICKIRVKLLLLLYLAGIYY